MSEIGENYTIAICTYLDIKRCTLREEELSKKADILSDAHLDAPCVVEGEPMIRRMVEAMTATSPIAAVIFGPLRPKREVRADWKVASPASIESPAI